MGIRRRLLLRAAIISAIAALAACVLWVRAGVQSALEAENRLHAWLIVSSAIEDQLVASGCWPGSWQELAAYPHESGGLFWPRDRARIEGLVSVRFDLTREQVAAMKPDTFDAVRPLGPMTEFWRIAVIEDVLQKVREPR